MIRDRLLYTRAAKVRIDMLPVEVRVHVETHLENLALLMEAAPERLPTMLVRGEEGFVTTVQGVRARFTVDTSARSLLVHCIESFPGTSQGAAAVWELPEVDS
jgi:hypothetical protein